jgi:hypothetical protein
MGRWLLLLLAFLALPLGAAESPPPLVVLEAVSAAPFSAIPPRFLLLEDGQVFVGGTRHLAAGRLERAEMKELEKRIARVRKIPGLGSTVSFEASGPARWRLRLAKGQPAEILLSGDPASAPPGLRPLASLVLELASFSNPSLRAYEPTQYALQAREGTLEGGCRSWGFTVPLTEALATVRAISAAAAADWPTGGTLASVCAGEKRYMVTLRPLLPGERP